MIAFFAGLLGPSDSVPRRHEGGWSAGLVWLDNAADILLGLACLAISVMLTMTPWRELAEGGGGVTGSPFVRAFATIGIPYAAGAMNVVVISAAISRTFRTVVPACSAR